MNRHASFIFPGFILPGAPSLFAVFLFTALAFVPAAAAGPIVVTEIHRDPAGRETDMPGGASHEFVEITNLGGEPFSLDSLFLSDGVDRDSVIAVAAPIRAHPGCRYGMRVLPPGACAVILDKNYDSTVSLHPSAAFPIADSAVLLTVADADLGNGLAADDGIVLYKGSGGRIDRIVAFALDQGQDPADLSAKRVLTAPGVSEGVSAVPLTILFGPVAYGPCPTGLSPGRFEPLDNGWIGEWKFGPVAEDGRAAACSIAVLGTGTHDPGTARIAVYGEPADTLRLLPLPGGGDGAARYVVSMPLDTVSRHLLIDDGSVALRIPVDISTVWLPHRAVRVSELFPRATAAVPEWIELVNTCAMPVNLKHWRFGNGESSDTAIPADLVLGPSAYLVLTADRAAFLAAYPAVRSVAQPPHWHTLDNWRDSVVLWDAGGSVRERVWYESGWFTQWSGGSLERIDVEREGTPAGSWAVAARPTPGMPNGSAAWRDTDAPSCAIGPTPFTPDRDGRDDLLAIRLKLPGSMAASVTIYGFNGRPMKRFAGTAAEYYWDGRTDTGEPAPAGPFFVVVELASPDRTAVLRSKGVLWR